MNEELLPIGTAVKLANDSTPFLIVGYYVPDSNNLVHKYMAVDCVLGFSNSSNAILLDDYQIEEVLKMGYSDPEGESMRQSISLLAEAMRAKSKSNEKDENE